jgi:hypothetical protein
MSGDLELRYAHLSKSKRDTPARRANRAVLAEYVEEIQAEQVEKNAALLIERHVEGSKCTAAPT